MHTKRILTLLILFLLASFPVWSDSLDEARTLYEKGQTEEALAAIESLLGSDADGDQKAAALDLLGSIAADKGHLSMAKQAWAQLKDEYPDYAADNDVGTKLLLVSALLKNEESAEPAPAPVPAPIAEPTVTETPAPVPTPVAAPPADPAPVESATPAPPAAPKTEPTPAPAPRESSGLVLVVGRGRPYDAAVEASERLVRHLREQGVDAESATGGIPVVQDSKMVLPFLLQKGQEEGAGSILVFKTEFARMQKIAMECYLPDGVSLWKLKVSGGTGVKGREYSKTGINENLVERFLEKLAEKIGGPGLPVTLK